MTSIFKLLLYVGLLLTLKEMPVRVAKNNLTQKATTTLNNWSLSGTIANDDLIGEDDDKDIADNGFDRKNQVGEDSRSGFYDFSGVLQEAKEFDLTKFFFSFYKSTHLFILFHCWKLLFG